MLNDHLRDERDAPREGEAPAEPPHHREGEAPAEPPHHQISKRLRASVVLPQRAHPVHGIKYVDGQPTIIYDTLCVKNRKTVLACDAFHRVFRNVAANATAWLMGRYVIMPDHIHFFAGDVRGNISYENWVRYLKSQLTKHFANERVVRSAAARREPRPPMAFRWLTDHWDTRVRNAQTYEEKWQYVLNNPIRAQLVTKADDWPFQGEIFELPWQ
jgi:putative transposase